MQNVSKLTKKTTEKPSAILPTYLQLNDDDRQIFESPRFERSSPKFQANFVFDKISNTGHSRHRAKLECGTNKIHDFHDVGMRTPIFSYTTRREYQKSLEMFLRWCRNRDNFDLEDSSTVKPCKNVFHITEKHLEKFIITKTIEGTKRSSLKKFSSAMNKVSAALNLIDQKNRDWEPAMKELRNMSIPTTAKPRAFKNPWKIINSLDGNMKIFATIHLTNGLRISEMRNFKKPETYETNIIKNTKGGRPRDVLTRQFEEFFMIHFNREEIQAAFKTYNEAAYCKELKAAAEKMGEKWTGSHSMRYSAARHVYWECMRRGASDQNARLTVSNFLGHNRLDITDRYLND